MKVDPVSDGKKFKLEWNIWNSVHLTRNAVESLAMSPHSVGRWCSNWNDGDWKMYNTFKIRLHFNEDGFVLGFLCQRLTNTLK